MKYKLFRLVIVCYLLVIFLWLRLCLYMLYMFVYVVVCIWFIEWLVIKV